MSDFKLSVITINRNNAEGLRKTMQSVLDQTSDNFEYIIIDGVSTDGSVDVIKDFLEHHPNASKISYWHSKSDKGIYNAMNIGVEKATGTYCHMLNSGDWYASNDVIEKIEKAGRTETILFSDANLVYDNKIKKKKMNYTLNAAFFASNGMINHQNMIVLTSQAKKRPFHLKYKYISDRAFLIESVVLDNANSYHLPFVMANYDLVGFSNAGAATEEVKILQNEYFPAKIGEDLRKLNEYETCYKGTLKKLMKIFKFYSKVKYKILKKR